MTQDYLLFNINMNSSAATKQLTWPLIQPYLAFLKTHQEDVESVVRLKENGKLKLPAAEESITQAIIEMYDFVVKILRENSIIESDSDKSKNKIEIIVREVLKLQDSFVFLNNSLQWNTESIIKTMKPQLEASLGATMS
jgi:hypothetical protein